MTKKLNEKIEVKTVYIVDRFNKRKFKKSTPTLLLGVLEKNPNSTLKDIENKTIRILGRSIIRGDNVVFISP